MLAIDNFPDTYDKDLFDRNMQCLEERQPQLAKALRSVENCASRVVADGDGVNLDLGHTLFYERDAATFVESQIEQFWKKPERIDVVGGGLGGGARKTTIAENRTMADKMLALSKNWMVDAEVTADVRIKDPDAGFLFVLGIGLGFHIDQLIDQADVRHVVIVEQFTEFMFHALHLHDLSSWFEKAEENGGSLTFFVGDNPSMLTNILFNFVKFKAFELTDGSYLYVHYNSYFLKEVEREFGEKSSLLVANPGFFEDELVMMTNCFHNITTYDHLTYAGRIRLEKHTPVVIVGSGPSLDGSIELLKANRDRLIIFSCGTGLGALLGYGIQPDFHVELENTPGPLEILTGLAEKHDLSSITLIAANTLNPDVPKLFQRRVLFFRDSVTSTFAFGDDYGPVYNAAPTVTNTAARMAVGLGFRNLYLVGVDLGSREKGKHHSQQSVYCADETFLETHPEHKSASDFKLRAKGNFGGTVLTNNSFLWSSTMFQALNDMVSNLVMTNCSDGIKITGARPQLPETVDFAVSTDRRNRELALVLNEHDTSRGKVPVSVASMEKIHTGMTALYDRVEEALGTFKPTKKGFYDLHDKLQPVVYGRADESNEAEVVRQFHVGTVMMFMQIAHIVLRRLPEDVREDYLIFFKGRFEGFLAEMRQRGLDCMSAIIEKSKQIEQ